MQLRGVGTNGKSGKFPLLQLQQPAYEGANGFVTPLQ